MARHLRSLRDLDADGVERIISLGLEVKQTPGAHQGRLVGRSVALVFAKPSTRTRVSFEAGLSQLGAHPVSLSTGGSAGLQTSRGETWADTAKVLSRYVDAIVIRTFAQQEIEELAEHGSVPVVNALTDAFHPCQALADVMTLREVFGATRGLRLVFVGPGNNVAHSLLLAGPRAGFDVICACPEGLPPDPTIFAMAQADAKAAGTTVAIEHDLARALEGARAVYTDTWVSMGQEQEAGELHERLREYQVTDKVMQAAAADAVFMHCLPAHRGEEVTAEVLDGPQSIVLDQAENRLHAQKALLLLLLGAEPWR